MKEKDITDLLYKKEHCLTVKAVFILQRWLEKVGQEAYLELLCAALINISREDLASGCRYLAKGMLLCL